MIVDFQDKRSIKQELRQELTAMAEYVLSKQQKYTKFYISVSTLTKTEMQQLNARTRNIDKPTDVLSYPSMSLTAGEKIHVRNADVRALQVDEEGNISLGDIVLCIDVAKQQAKEFGNTLNQEIKKLFLHSLLHLLGYDHIQDEDYAKMRKAEQKYGKLFEIGK